MEKIYICEEGYVNLKNAIVRQAAEDYLDIKKLCYVMNRAATKKEQAMLDDIVEFFDSDWYEMLCKIDGRRLLKMIDAHFEEWKTNTDEVNQFKKMHKKRKNKKKESEEA